MSEHKIAVLMPVYNSEEFLSLSIESILNQSYENFDFLIINDGSTDSSESIILRYAEKDKRIKYHKLQKVGFAKALNYGLNKSETDIILRMDSDDIALPDLIDEQLKFFFNEKTDLAGCSHFYFINSKLIYPIKFEAKHKIIKKKLALYSLILHSGLIYNKKCIIENGGYSEAKKLIDYATYLKIKDKVTFAVNPKILVFYRYRSNSLSREKLDSFYSYHYELQESYYKNSLIEEFGIEDKKEELEFRAWREYFYGDMAKARAFWKEALRYGIVKDYRVYIAFTLSFLPKKILLKIKELRLRYRINYLIKYFFKENKYYRKLFKQIVLKKF